MRLPWFFLGVTVIPLSLVAQDSARAHRIDSLVVTAERRPTSTAATPAVVRVITSAEWREKGAGDLTTLLREIPGLQLDPVVGAGDGISIQGLGSDRVQVLIDGAPVEGRLSNQFDLTRLDPNQFDRVEVVEGPQSTLYGSTALGGVINLISRTPDGPHVEVTSQGGSFGQFDQSGRASALIGTTAFSVDAGHRRIDIAPGTGVGTPGSAERWDFSASLLKPLGNAVLAIRALHTRESQRYAESFGPGFDFGNAAQNRQTDVLGSLRFNGEATELRLHASVYDHTLDETDQSSGVTTTDPQQQRLVDVELVHRGTTGRIDWVAGVRGEHEWITSARLVSSDESTNTAAVYGSAEWHASSSVALSVGGRATVADRWGTDVAPRVGLVWHDSHGIYAKVTAAGGFRAPSFIEQFSSFTNAEAFYAVQGNPDLKPEHSWNLTGEMGVRVHRLEWYLRGYGNQLRDFIEADYTGQNGEIAEFTYLNVVKAHTAGAEVGGRVGYGIATIEASYAYLDARDETNDQPLLGRAPSTVRGALTLARSGWSLTAEAVRASRLPISQDMSSGALVYQGATPRINLHGTVALTHQWQLNAGVDNAANVIPENAIAGFGRRWFAGVTWGI